jgi:predicted ATPase
MLRAEYISAYLDQLRVYHFHDTGPKSPFTSSSLRINGDMPLDTDGGDLAGKLSFLQRSHPKSYRRILRTVQQIAPYFFDFVLKPGEYNLLYLRWRDRYSDYVYGATDLSDGTIRFIALATLFLQPALPDVIIIDEPELGLHPYAIAKLAGMIQQAAARGCKVIVATQSPILISHFQPEDIITVDLVDGASQFNRLKADQLARWLEAYSMGDLWSRNIIDQGQP